MLEEDLDKERFFALRAATTGSRPKDRRAAADAERSSSKLDF